MRSGGGCWGGGGTGKYGSLTITLTIVAMETEQAAVQLDYIISGFGPVSCQYRSLSLQLDVFDAFWGRVLGGENLAEQE